MYLSSISWSLLGEIENELLGQTAFGKTYLEKRVRRKFYVDKGGSKWFEKGLQRLEDSESGVPPPCYSPHPLKSQGPGGCDSLRWDAVPPSINFHNQWASSRPELRLRKQQQVTNLAAILTRVLKGGHDSGQVVVDFCGGSGHLALPLAFLFPQHTFIIVDLKAGSLDLAEQRAASVGLKNVQLVHSDVRAFTRPFHVGVALHACGEATDLVHMKCVEAKAAYILASCCVGKVQHSSLQYPRSHQVDSVMTKDEYLAVAKAADVPSHVLTTDVQRRRRLCKSYIEVDRNLWAKENGYCTHLLLMSPLSASPKNDIIVGVFGDGQQCAICSLPPSDELANSEVDWLNTELKM